MNLKKHHGPRSFQLVRAHSLDNRLKIEPITLCKLTKALNTRVNNNNTEIRWQSIQLMALLAPLLAFFCIYICMVKQFSVFFLLLSLTMKGLVQPS